MMMKSTSVHTEPGGHLLRKLNTIMDYPSVLSLRVTILIVGSLFLLFVAVKGALSQTIQDQIKAETRIVQLEDAVHYIQSDIQAIKDEAKENRFFHWLELGGLASLLGEMGIRISRKR